MNNCSRGRLFVVFILFINSLNGQDKVIDIDSNSDFNSYFSKQRTIELETKNDFYLSLRADISHIDDEKIIMSDYRFSKQIFVFNNKGEGIGKIGREGRGPGEYLGPRQLIYQDEKYYVIESRLFQIICYDSDFNYSHNISTEVPYECAKFIGDYIYCMRTNMYGSSNKSVIEKLSLDGEKVLGFCEQSDLYHQDLEATGGGFVEFKNSIFVVTPYEYEIRQFTYEGELLNTYTVNNSKFIEIPQPNKKKLSLNEVFELGVKWTPIRQVINVGKDYMVVVFSIREKDKSYKTILNIFDQMMNPIGGNITLPEHHSDLYSKGTSLYITQKDDIDTDDNQSIVEYVFKPVGVK